MGMYVLAVHYEIKYTFLNYFLAVSYNTHVNISVHIMRFCVCINKETHTTHMWSIWKKNSLCCAVLNRFLFRLGILTASLLHHLIICKMGSSTTQVTAPLISSFSISKLGWDFCVALVFQAWVSWDHGPTCLHTLVAYNFWHWHWIWCGHVSLSTGN